MPSVLETEVHKFRNRLRIMRYIEADDLRRAGIELPGDRWQRFSSNPYDFLIRADDATAEAIFSIIQKQETR